ncbi:MULTISPECIES: hypothetical protein [unclassified Mesorhizobium]|uniref:hypothetical protein n=1 Tax=unclassified Mesorhizobium TaxID=325217 RepID=UPI000FCCD8C9|nr:MULTISPECIES: hypothetical protein [unclassified Mesorhizobium]TGP34041.1 hypothetical protein EN875_012385 [Mesorhizobium sp. M2D.F.Ca.ET.232.01.1.1]TGQ23812.1 hypothetical protein EN863_064915 [Mesorhizobium sp. M00.F.Ca.ET.220.01.1.1]TGU12194.1 hypothetical protein EN806_17355 [bacterium M00.F.Ca.ET.163.01.1.1]TGV15792.1 hypothetical protein EN816_00640 [Mesorhizobium sp. M8A.F.Ca.ET.173.01.1.1]
MGTAANWTPEQQKEHRKLWVQALRSGEYEQGRKRLHLDSRYCCLGVACVLAGKDEYDMGARLNLSNLYDVMEFYGLRDHNGAYGEPNDMSDSYRVCLAQKNDSGTPFAAIADIIESEPPGLFIS